MGGRVGGWAGGGCRIKPGSRGDGFLHSRRRILRAELFFSQATVVNSVCTLVHALVELNCLSKKDKLEANSACTLAS